MTDPTTTRKVHTMTDPTTTRKVHTMRTMKPGSIIVHVTATTASGCTYTGHHPAESGEWFLNSLLLAALDAAGCIANITRSDADPYQMRAMCDRLLEMWEDERMRMLAADAARARNAKLRASWESARMTSEEAEQWLDDVL